jgi:hypothetical protein
MPKDGAVTLSDVRGPMLGIVCQPCARRRRHAVATLIQEHGDAKLTELLVTLANCPKARPARHVRSLRRGVRGACGRAGLRPDLRAIPQVDPSDVILRLAVGEPR